MDLTFTPEEERFREAVRTFVATELPRPIADKVATGKRLTKSDMQSWHDALGQRGWLASHWPVEYGGPGWNPVQRFIFENECALANAPRIVPFGVNMLGPVLIKYGSEAQRHYWLPRILDGTDWWCQGFSEPGAGSDLASLKTSAVRDGTSYIVNGQKTWTTWGHYANRIFCLVRTDPQARKQEGIGFLLMDLNTPGVEVRPIITLDGEHEINEVFFTNVRVPVENLVGQESLGWTYAKYLLTYERTNIAGVGHSVAAFERLRRFAAKPRRNLPPLSEDPLFAARMAQVEIDLENMKTTQLRVIAAAAGETTAGVVSSMLKIRGTQIRQEISSLTRRAMGPYAQPFLPEVLDGGTHQGVGPEEAAAAAVRYFNERKLSIFGGSNEIQRNIIAKMLLGL